MNKIVVTLALVLSISISKAQVVHLELDLRNHLNNSDNITGCILEPTTSSYKIYIHSGVCSATTPGVPDPTDCDNPSFVWEHVVGDWGMDNGHGLMTEVTDSVWAIDIDLSSYYSDPATISQTGGGSAGASTGASTPMPVGATAYSMGFVFRNEDGTIGGLTGGCTDFFIFDLDQGNTSVDVGLPGYTLPDSTFNVSSTTSLNELVSVEVNNVYPNPFTDRVKIFFQLTKAASNGEITIYDNLGRIVKSLYNGFLHSGSSQIEWDGTNDIGGKVCKGMYYAVIKANDSVKSEMIIKK